MKRIPRHRRKEGKTDYEQRLALLKSGKPRVVVRITNTRILTQLTFYDKDGDTVGASASSDELADHGWDGGAKNIPAAYLTGQLLAARTDVDEAVLDTGVHNAEHGGRLFAVAAGAREAGMDVPVGAEAVPSEDRLHGDHVDNANVEEVAEQVTP